MAELEELYYEEEDNSLKEQEEEADNEPRAFASSMIAEAGYNADNQELEVTFNNGKTESYEASKEEWDDLKNAPSPGRWMLENILRR